MIYPKGQAAGPSWPQEPRSRLALALRDATPIVMGYVPIGLALGVLAAQAGLTPVETGAMSVLVYAGASQFIGVSMLAAGMSPFAIGLTTLLVNLRHVLMSAALSPYFQRLRPVAATVAAFFITDESFAVSAATFRARGGADAVYMVGLYGTAYTSWVLATVIGALLGAVVRVPDGLALDFALPAMFIGLLAGQLRDKPGIAAAAAAGASAALLGPHVAGWAVMIASVVGATVGVGVGRWNRGSSRQF